MCNFRYIEKFYDQKKQIDIIDRLRNGTKTLLILGEPGSGKTIALLQLAKRLIEQAKYDKNRPIPVIFNLSSWGQKDESLEKWLIKELKDKYYVPETISQRWLKEEQLQLLLDGLDEVGADLKDDEIAQEKKRKTCVKAINEFISDDHLQTDIVICSRIEDYKNLEQKLSRTRKFCKIYRRFAP
ncbi:MAG: NACHT domain-containing NTPase [Xenococcaceae cyanobacterium]